jgi:hypothetical protein
MQYRTKPAVVDAFPLPEFKLSKDDTGREVSNWPPFVKREVGVVEGRPQLVISIPGPDGPQYLSVGDYIVRNAVGQVFVVDKGRFEEEYEVIEGDEEAE